jgi:hypothetical protein
MPAGLWSERFFIFSLGWWDKGRGSEDGRRLGRYRELPSGHVPKCPQLRLLLGVEPALITPVLQRPVSGAQQKLTPEIDGFRFCPLSGHPVRGCPLAITDGLSSLQSRNGFNHAPWKRADLSKRRVGDYLKRADSIRQLANETRYQKSERGCYCWPPLRAIGRSGREVGERAVRRGSRLARTRE